MAKGKRAVSVISGADGPTSVVILKRNSKLTLSSDEGFVYYAICTGIAGEMRGYVTVRR